MTRALGNPLYLFLLCILVPPDIVFNFGPLSFPFYRLYLLLIAPFCLMKYLSLEKTRVDLFVFLYLFWAIVAIFYNHGASQWQFCGLLFVETITPYLLARIYLTDQGGFEDFVKLYFAIVLVLLPFALYETLTGDHILRDIARKLVGKGDLIGRPGRLGLERAYGPFEHPIHFGFFCSAIFGMVVALRGSFTQAVMRWGAVFVSVFCSLSSGPLLSLMLQAMLKGWDWVTGSIRARWRILALLFVVAYIAIDLLSNRTPFHVLVTYATLRLASAYNRIQIFEFGSASVVNNPVFGIGLNEWERPEWMSSSMDNFWLLTAVRYGVPGLIFLVLALVVLFRRLASADVDETVAAYRKGWSISIVAIIIAGCTVHFWNALYCLLFAIIGASGWILYAKRATDEEETAARPSPRPAPMIGAGRPAPARIVQPVSDGGRAKPYFGRRSDPLPNTRSNVTSRRTRGET